MKRIAFLLTTLSFALTTNTVSAMDSFDGAFVGINVSMNGCRIQTEDESFSYMGHDETKTSLISNHKMMIATCKAIIPNDFITNGDAPDEETMEDLSEAVVERADIPCQIMKKKDTGKGMQKFNGFGGFTVTPSGILSSRCKVIR